ncbi:helix-turn-helix domain-containing protein [Paenibacillus antri]|nr:helix-turn-helix domain-containing protein [Paenibacillus antri]
MRKRTNSLFYKLFLSYIVIFAIPLIILIGVFYFVNVVSYQREIADSNLAKLTQVRDQIDLELKSIREIIYHISAESDIYSTTDSAKREGLLVPQMAAYVEHYPFINDLMFYYRGDTKIYLNSGRYAYDYFEYELKKDFDWTKASFFRELNAVSAPKAKRIENKSSIDPSGESKIAFLYPVPYLNKFPQATILATMSESEFLSKFSNILGDIPGYLAIYDNYYSPLVSFNHMDESAQLNTLDEDLQSVKGTGVFSVRSGHIDFVVTRMFSEESNWSYVIAMPEHVFYERAYRMRSAIIGISLFLLVVGVVGAFLLSSRSYKPIRALLAYFTKPEYRPDDDTQGKNELEIIRYTFDNTLQKHQEVLVRMNAQRPFIKDQCLLTLLKGRTADPNERDYLIACSNVMMDGEAFFCMAISSQQPHAAGADLGRLVVLLETMTFVGGWGYGVELANEPYIVMIFVLKDMPEDGVRKRLDIANSVSALAEEELGVGLAIGIGKLYPDLDHIGSSHLEASAALFDNQLNAKRSIHLYEDLDGSGQLQAQWHPMKELALYIQSLKQGDEAVALETVKLLIEQMTSRTTSFLFVRCLCFDVVNHIMKTLQSMNGHSLLSDIRELLQFNSLQEFQSSLEDFTRRFCKQVKEYKDKMRIEQKNSIISYIQTNFKDSQLSLERIAERFGLSTTYLSRFIKEETGVTFIDFLSNLRMNEAKLQLQKTDKLIQDIVMDVGYLNVPSFVRKFKAAEGVTPGQYRDLVGNS